jgi:hypothetical protein
MEGRVGSRRMGGQALEAPGQSGNLNWYGGAAAHTLADPWVLPNAPLSADTGESPPRSSATDFGPSPPQDNVYNKVLSPPPAAPAAATQLASDIGPGNPANYVSAVGKPNSGKTTLQGHLLRYLFTGGHHNAEPDPAYIRDKDYFQNVRIEWDHAWRNGLFPERTVAGRPADFR